MTLLTALLVLVALVSLATDLISTMTEESDHEGHSDNDIDVDD